MVVDDFSLNTHCRSDVFSLSVLRFFFVTILNSFNNPATIVMALKLSEYCYYNDNDNNDNNDTELFT